MEILIQIPDDQQLSIYQERPINWDEIYDDRLSDEIPLRIRGGYLK